MAGRAQAGVTLIEMMISLAISSVVMVSLLGMTSMHINVANRSSSRAALSVDMMFLMDYFSRVIPSAGGELLPVWSAIGVENNCTTRGPFPNCQNSDRLTVVNVVGTAACSISGVAGGGASILLDTSSGTCCIDALGLEHAHVVLTRVTFAAERFVTAVDRVNCTLTVTPGPAAFNDNVVEPYDWSGGAVFPVQVRTFYLDRANQEIVRYTFTNGGVTDKFAGRASPLADRVLDFQVSLGYDFNPVDGVVSDTGGAGDEYLYNWTGGTETFGSGYFLNASRTNLRMVALGLIIGQPSANPNASGPIRVLDGAIINDPSWIMERQVSRYMMRSTRAYQ